ncbi:MAG: hypothetical protein IKS31_01350 [Clostridia bacterium]|nr:hypothetical protein [Clostridia bacterium]
MLPTLQPFQKASQTAVNLQGLNLTGTPQDASGGYNALEWEWTQNTDTVQAPIVRRREKRILVGQLEKPNGIAALDKLAFVDGEKFYYNGYYWGDLEDSPKTMIGMGSRLVIFPDKVIFDTTEESPVGYSFTPMEQENVTSGDVTVTLARADGTPYTDYETGTTPPENPENGDLWLDTSGSPIVMKSWSEYTGMWVDEYTTCVSVQAAGIGTGLRQDDAVEVSGLQAQELNGTWILLSASANSIVFTGIIAEQLVQSGQVTVKRSVPDMDYVIEHNNRLWGCSSANHEIYACALGDPTNWRRYAGISTDSYAVTVGSPGPFTGAAVVNSNVCFFKEDCIHKIYGTMPSNFQMTVDHYRGCEDGSAGSIVRINELVYYKSRFDVCAYDGAEVAGRGQAIGPRQWRNAVAGRNDRRLYISMQDTTRKTLQDPDGTWELLVYDTETGYWMREDGTHALGFASLLTETFMLTADGNVWALRSGEYADNAYMIPYGTQGAGEIVIRATEETDADIPWLLRTGWIAARYSNNKRIGKIQMLVGLDTGAAMTVKVRKDNENWETAMSITADGTRRYTLPIYPRRCDRLEIELSGTGGVMLYGMSWQIEAGSEYGR